MDLGDPYIILGVSADATDEELRQAYLERARRWHPDRLGSASPAERVRAEREMGALTDAWRKVGDPQSRRAHDRSRVGSTRVAAPPPTVRRPPPRREPRPAPRVVTVASRRLSPLLTVGGLLLFGVGLIVAILAVALLREDSGSSLSENDVRGRCVLPPGADGLVSFAPRGCGTDTPIILRRVFDPTDCAVGGFVAARLADSPDVIVCLDEPEL